MAKNQSKEFATMDDDERRKFAMTEEGETNAAGELNFQGEDVRDDAGMGRHYADPKEEFADPENRDGPAAQLDAEAHERNARKNSER